MGVAGLDRFRAYFADYTDQYVLIGGAAAFLALWLAAHTPGRRPSSAAPGPAGSPQGPPRPQGHPSGRPAPHEHWHEHLGEASLADGQGWGRAETGDQPPVDARWPRRMSRVPDTIRITPSTISPAIQGS